MKTSPHRFCLYVTGSAPNSLRARDNLAEICQQFLPDRHEIEIVDLTRNPERALSDGIFITPTLVRRNPGTEVRIMGSLSDRPVVLASLQLNDCAVSQDE